MCAKIIIYSNDERNAVNWDLKINKLQYWYGCVELEIFAHDQLHSNYYVLPEE